MDFQILDLTPTCSSGSFCRAQPPMLTVIGVPLFSTGHTVEGWGLMGMLKFTPGGIIAGSADHQMLTADVSQFDGVVVSKSMVDGLLSVSLG